MSNGIDGPSPEGIGILSEDEKDKKTESARTLFESHGFNEGDSVTIKKFNPASQEWEIHEDWKIALIPSGVEGKRNGEDHNPSLLAVNPEDPSDFTNIPLQELLELNKK